MVTGRISRKVLDYIYEMKRTFINKRLQKDLRKEVETGKNGTQKYVVKQGENKGKIL
jgi:phosphopantetheine adenylyltransferase